MFILEFWEVQRIISGYRKRHRFEQELLRLNAYCAFYAMRENSDRLSPSEWMPLPWEKAREDAEDDDIGISLEEERELMELVRRNKK